MTKNKIKLDRFEPTIQWWRHCLEEHGCHDLAKRFEDDACWDAILKAHKEGSVPEAVIEAAVAAIADCEDRHSFIAFTLMRIIGPREELIDKIARSKNAEAAYAYCRHFGDHATLRPVVRDKGDERLAFYYCRDVANAPDVARVVLTGSDAKIMTRFHRDVINRDLHGQ